MLPELNKKNPKQSVKSQLLRYKGSCDNSPLLRLSSKKREKYQCLIPIQAIITTFTSFVETLLFYCKCLLPVPPLGISCVSQVSKVLVYKTNQYIKDDRIYLFFFSNWLSKHNAHEKNNQFNLRCMISNYNFTLVTRIVAFQEVWKPVLGLTYTHFNLTDHFSFHSIFKNSSCQLSLTGIQYFKSCHLNLQPC